MDEANLGNWVIFGISVLVLIWVGMQTNKKVVKAASDEGGFLLAGRTLGPVVGAGTIVATGFSGWGFMGSPGTAYAFGTTELLGNFFFGFSMVIAVLFIAKFLYRRALKMGSMTIPEFLSQVHEGTDGEKRAVQALASIITVILLSVFMVGQVRALGLLGGTWLGISFEAAAVIMVAIIVLYTSLGGLAAVAWTDTLMVAGMSISAIVICFQMFSDIPLMEMVARLREIAPAHIDPPTAEPYGATRGHISLLLPYTMMFSAVLPYMSIRLMSFRPDVKAHHCALIAAPVALLLSLVPIVGLYMRIRMPGLDIADNAMPMYLQTYMPPLVAGIITLFILFAMQSTANSVLHVVSSAVSHDLRKAIKPNQNLPHKKALTLNRAMVALFGGISLLMMSFAPPTMLNLIAIIGTGTLNAALLGPLLLSAFWRGNAKGAIAAMLTGFIVCGLLMLQGGLGWIEPPIYASIVSVVAYIVVSKLTAKVNEGVGEVTYVAS